jgi:hypothetical protein
MRNKNDAPPSLAVVVLPERRLVALFLALLPHLTPRLGPPPPLGPLGRLLAGVALVLLPERRVFALGLALLPRLAATLGPEPPFARELEAGIA